MVQRAARADRLSLVFAALAHPGRRSMLARLALGEAPVKELAEPLRMSLPAVTKHLRVLERAGLVRHRRQAQWRLYRLEAAPLREAAEWAARCRRLWEASRNRPGDPPDGASG